MAKKTEEQNYASICPEDMTEGGGLLDNIRATVTSAVFEMSNYDGRSSMTRPAANIVLEEPDGDEHTDQFWSAGKADDWVPSDDGNHLIPTSLKTQIHKSSNFGMLMASIVDAGYPMDKIREYGGSIQCLVGMTALWQQVPTGRDAKEKDGKTYEDTCLCVAEIEKFPWEKDEKAGKKKGRGKGGGAAKSGAKKPSASTGKKAAAKDDGGGEEDIEATAAEWVMEALMADGNEDGVAKKELATFFMGKAKTDGVKPAQVNKMIRIVFDDEWVGSDDHPWDYDDGVLTMGG